MSDFWTAAARVRSGAGGDAALRPVSRFEADPGFPVFETEHSAADPVEPPADVAAEQASPVPVQAIDGGKGLPETPGVAQATAVSGAAADVAPAEDAERVVAGDLPAPVERTVYVDRERIDVRVVREPARSAPSRRSSAQPRSVLAQTVTREEAFPESSPVDVGFADPPAASSAVPVVTAIPKALEAPEITSPSPAPPSSSTPLPPAPVHVRIEHIDIRIDPPALTVVPRPTRRAAAPVDLNDYLARGGR